MASIIYTHIINKTDQRVGSHTPLRRIRGIQPTKNAQLKVGLIPAVIGFAGWRWDQTGRNMKNVKRYYDKNQVVFTTHVTYNRKPILFKNAKLLLESITKINDQYNFELIAWVILQMSFRGEMAGWTYVAGELFSQSTPLEILKFEGLSSFLDYSYYTTSDLFIGRTTGFIGEVSAIALLIGGVFLIVRRVISWHIPVGFIAGVVFLSGIFWLVNPDECADPIFHLLAGGVLLAAFFVATDMPSSPTTPIGMLTYGFLCGLLTIVIRLWGRWDDGAFYSVFIISMLTPLLDKFKPKVYGR